MDLQLLVETLTILLSRALPHLIGAGEKVAGKVGDEVAEQAGKTVWEKLRGRLKPSAREAAEDVAAAPDDPDNLAALRKQLKKLLKDDEELRGELERLASTVNVSVSGGQVAVGRDVNGNVITINMAAGAMSPERLQRILGDLIATPDLSAASTRYLELLIELHRHLDFRGMGISDRVPLRLPLLEMYVPLKARLEMPKGEAWSREQRVAGRRLSAEEVEAVGERLSAPQPVLDLLNRHDGLILLGDPGAGKTTFLKFLALTVATGQGQALGLGDRLPVLLPLSAYAEASDEVSLLDFFDRYYQDRDLGVPIAGLLEQALKQGRALVLLDGLDEVRELHRRHVVVDRVRDFYVTHRQAGNKFVLTSRIVGYREARLQAERMAECTLIDFDDEEIQAFVERWTKALEKAAAGAGAVAAQRAEEEQRELLAAVERNPGVRQLATNPLLLTILALMKRQGVTLPERRVELYDKYIETLLRHWNLARGLDRRSGRELDVVATLRVLAPLALWMHRTSPGVGLVKEQEMQQELERIYDERGEKDPEAAARAFLADVRDHAGLLIERGGRRYGFLHLTFQEYLAAVAVAQMGQQDVAPVVKELAAHVGEAPWREVSLLTIGYLGIIQQRDEAAGAVLGKLIDRAPGKPGEVVVFAGEAVADAWPGGVSETCRQRVIEELLSTLGAHGRVAAPVRAAAGRALAAIGDPRPEVMSVDGMEFCEVPSGTFMMGSDDTDKQAWKDEKPSHSLDLPYDYQMARFPVTVAQFREFLAATGQDLAHPGVHGEPGNHPVRRVSWDEAVAFCAWLTSHWRASGRLRKSEWVVLPSEAEWEKAARGCDGQRYPWGKRLDPDLANYKDTRIGNLSAVGCFPGGKSPYGCEEMSGNVWEWTRSLWGRHSFKADFGYPYNHADGREDIDGHAQNRCVIRGGGFNYNCRGVRCSFRFGASLNNRWQAVGLRVALCPSP